MKYQKNTSQRGRQAWYGRWRAQDALQ
ncbi:hypothetical protein LINPERHAP1_LOCUS3860 [Linum perenne]